MFSITFYILLLGFIIQNEFALWYPVDHQLKLPLEEVYCFLNEIKPGENNHNCCFLKILKRTLNRAEDDFS